MGLIVRVIIPLSKTTFSFSKHKFVKNLGLGDAASETHLMKTCPKCVQAGDGQEEMTTKGLDAMWRGS